MAPLDDDVAIDAAALVVRVSPNLEADAQAVADILDGAIVEVLDPRLPCIHVEPNAGEEDDANIPKNLHNAAELFHKTGNVDAVQRMQRCTAVFFALVEGRCKVESVNEGHACLCWLCGHCGLERSSLSAPVVLGKGARMCNQCGESAHTNYVQVVLADGITVPWREIGATKIEDTTVRIEEVGRKDAQEDDKAAKRAAIAASVQAAREAQAVAAAAAKASAKGPEPKSQDVDSRLRSIQIKPNGEEAGHAKFPKNLQSALELFTRVGHQSSAQQMQKCTVEFLRVCDDGPQVVGRSGQGHICFSCGYCGLEPENRQLAGRVSETACFCGGCGDDSHTNFLQLELPNGQQLPWMERVGSAVS